MEPEIPPPVNCSVCITKMQTTTTQVISDVRDSPSENKPAFLFRPFLFPFITEKNTGGIPGGKHLFFSEESH